MLNCKVSQLQVQYSHCDSFDCASLSAHPFGCDYDMNEVVWHPSELSVSLKKFSWISLYIHMSLSQIKSKQKEVPTIRGHTAGVVWAACKQSSSFTSSSVSTQEAFRHSLEEPKNMLTAAVVHEKAGNGFIHTVCSDFMPLKKHNNKKKQL